MGIDCYQCSASESMYCSDNMIHNDILTATTCDHVFEASYCVKTVGLYGGTSFIYIVLVLMRHAYDRSAWWGYITIPTFICTLLISKKSVKVIILYRQVMFVVIHGYTSYSIVHTELKLHYGLLSFSSDTDRIYIQI